MANGWEAGKHMKTFNRESEERVQRARYEYDLKQEFEHSVRDRVERYLSVFQWKFTPYTHFSPISAECRLLYRDGYFFACIALCQSVAEALSRFLYMRLVKGAGGNKHIKRVMKLMKDNKISVESGSLFDRIHEHRDDFHHLNPETPIELEKLKEIAFGVLKSLSDIENEVFAFSLKDGVPIPKYPDLWRTETIEALKILNRNSTNIDKKNKGERR